jgi:uncharacterized protein (DUF362 family)
MAGSQAVEIEMETEHPQRQRKSPLSRRTFLKLGAGTLTALAAGGALAGCRLFTQTAAPATYEPVPTAEPQPTATPPPLPTEYTPVLATPTNPPRPASLPTSTPEPPPALSRAALMAHWPDTATSRVVLVRHSGAWIGDDPDPAIVRQMLDAGLSTLTGAADTLAVWRALFDPTDRVLLKVNCIAYGGPTQPAVTYAIAQRLQDAGLFPENILIFDRTDHELAAAGYTLNEGGSNVQCHGARGSGSEATLTQARIRFYPQIDNCDAIINVPTPKQHDMAGISIAMKNHYGSIANPGALHGSRCDPAIAELNAQPNVRDKTRLVVSAALNVSPADWNRPVRENALLLSFDPVALDTVSRDILVRQRRAMGMNADFLIEGAPQLQTAQSLELGATDAGLIDLREIVLG